MVLVKHIRVSLWLAEAKYLHNCIFLSTHTEHIYCTYIMYIPYTIKICFVTMKPFFTDFIIILFRFLHFTESNVTQRKMNCVLI